MIASHGAQHVVDKAATMPPPSNDLYSAYLDELSEPERERVKLFADTFGIEPADAVWALMNVLGRYSDLREAVPEKVKLTVQGILEKIQSPAGADAQTAKTRVLASSTAAFVPEPLLDTDQAASIIRIHPKTLQKLARRGEIRAVQIGKVWRFRASILEDWIQQKFAS
jgi:excisionase family DNA binding protein